MSKLTDRVSDIARSVVEEEGCRLWDVEYVKEAGTWYLRVLIDRDNGVSIDDCERISRRLDPILDKEDPIPDSYVFEVGSAGADRVLKRPSDFAEFMGSEVELSLYRPVSGSRRYVGVLTGYDNGDVCIEVAGKPMTFLKDGVAQVRLYVSLE